MLSTVLCITVYHYQCLTYSYVRVYIIKYEVKTLVLWAIWVILFYMLLYFNGLKNNLNFSAITF